jgi:glycosyltransferase involved in cell wall biosynthesis
MKQLVDVVIPAFNAAHTVRSAVESIQQQTLRDIRIIVVDDGSTDETATIVRGLASDRRVQLLSRRNGGIAEARNAGLAACKAELIAWLDADDLAPPDRLARQVAYLDANPDCVAVSGAHRYLDESGRFHGLVSPPFDPPDAADPLHVPAREPYLVQSFLMFRRATMERLGGYRHLLASEDSDLCWRMQEIGRLHNMAEVVGDIRIHDASVSARSIVGGRIMALYSQLAAISARRRRSGDEDLVFTKTKAARSRSLERLQEMVAVWSEELTAEERSWLALASAAKLMELASCRPYELDFADCRFVRNAMARHAGALSAENRKLLFRSCAGTAARLLQKGLVREAGALLSPRLYPSAAGRLALRTVASPAQLARLRQTLGRAPNVLMK